MSSDDFQDVDSLIDALRADVPCAQTQERVALRLMAAGVLVAGAGLPAGAAAASGGAGVAGGAWGTWASKLAATGWTAKLAVAAVASAVIMGPALGFGISPRAPAEEGLRVASARQHLAVAAPVARAVHGSVTVAADADRAAQLMAASTDPPRATGSSPASGGGARASSASVSADAAPQVLAGVRARGLTPASSGTSRAGSASVGGASTLASSRASTSPADRGRPLQLVAAGSGLRSRVGRSSAVDSSAVRAPASSATEGLAVRSSANTASGLAADGSALRLSDAGRDTRPASGASAGATERPQPSGAPASPPSAADAAATKYYAGPELSRPRLAGVRRRPASELARETQLIERALAALRVDDVAAARSWLNLHAARYPDGWLSRDRERVLQRIEESARARRAGRASAEHDERQ